MKQHRWYIVLTAVLILFSILTYSIQILIFNKPDDTFFYLLQDLSFVPIQVLLVTLILEQLLNRKEKQAMRNKLNMVIGAFFTDMGTELTRMLAAYDTNGHAFRSALFANINFSESNLEQLKSYLNIHEYRIQSKKQDLSELQHFLIGKREGVMHLLENQNLMEHETFTDLLWAVSHLTEELSYRKNVLQINEPDRKHLEGDIVRAYSLLTAEWLDYVRHLRVNYPYIFSLVVRINPFDPDAAAEVKA